MNKDTLDKMIEDTLDKMVESGYWIAFFNQTPELCVKAIRDGLNDRSVINIPWTDDMEKEWLLRNV